MELIIQHKTIESVLERGEKLDNLVERSNALSAQSKMFYKTAKKVSPSSYAKGYRAHVLAKLVLRDHVIRPAGRSSVVDEAMYRLVYYTGAISNANAPDVFWFSCMHSAMKDLKTALLLSDLSG